MQVAESEIGTVEASEGVGRKEQPIVLNLKLASESAAKDTDGHLSETEEVDSDRQPPGAQAPFRQQAEAQPKLPPGPILERTDSGKQAGKKPCTTCKFQCSPAVHACPQCHPAFPISRKAAAKANRAQPAAHQKPHRSAANAK